MTETTTTRCETGDTKPGRGPISINRVTTRLFSPAVHQAMASEAERWSNCTGRRRRQWFWIRRHASEGTNENRRMIGRASERLKSGAEFLTVRSKGRSSQERRQLKGNMRGTEVRIPSKSFCGSRINASDMRLQRVENFKQLSKTVKWATIGNTKKEQRTSN